MSNILSDLTYSDSHLWVRDEGDGFYSIGLTDYAQEQLGEIAEVELPEEADTLSAGDEFAVIESAKTSVELFTPLSGEITEVNHELFDAPGLINSDPYHDGWLIKLKADDETEQDDLLSSEEYEESLAEEEE